MAAKELIVLLSQMEKEGGRDGEGEEIKSRLRSKIEEFKPQKVETRERPLVDQENSWGLPSIPLIDQREPGGISNPWCLTRTEIPNTGCISPSDISTKSTDQRGGIEKQMDAATSEVIIAH